MFRWPPPTLLVPTICSLPSHSTIYFSRDLVPFATYKSVLVVVIFFLKNEKKSHLCWLFCKFQSHCRHCVRLQTCRKPIDTTWLHWPSTGLIFFLSSGSHLSPRWVMNISCRSLGTKCILHQLVCTYSMNISICGTVLGYVPLLCIRKVTGRANLSGSTCSRRTPRNHWFIIA